MAIPREITHVTSYQGAFLGEMDRASVKGSQVVEAEEVDEEEETLISCMERKTTAPRKRKQTELALCLLPKRQRYLPLMHAASL